MMQVLVGSRWIHRGCKRIARVTKVNVRAGEIEFHYERGPGMSIGFHRTKRPTQTMGLDQWCKLFLVEAHPRD